MDLSSRGITVTRMMDDRSSVETASRALRPRSAKTDYCEAPDMVVVEEEDGQVSAGGEEDGQEEEESDGEEKPLPPVCELSAEQRRERVCSVRRLREELRAEETKLVLLQRIKQLQSRPVSATGAVVTENCSGALRVSNATSGSGSTPVAFTPPPGVSVTLKTAVSRGASSSSRPQPAHVQSLRSSSSAAVSVLPVGSQQRALTAEVDIKRESGPPAVSRHWRHSQQHEERQTAAKLALRKQLEKTLLQIPPPKPPPPHISFVPNANNSQFVCLLGLEHAVDYLKNENQNKRPCENLVCDQCSRDFTPVWRRESGASRSRGSTVTCEQCYTSNVKKKLKAEHTSRLKAAFVKAMQQEQDMDAQLARLAASPLPSPETTITPIPARRQPVHAHQSARHSPRPRESHRSHASSASETRGSRAATSSLAGNSHTSVTATPATSTAGAASKLSAVELEYMKKLADPKLSAQLLNPVMMAAAMNQSAAALAAQQHLLRLPQQQQQQQQQMFPAAFNPLLYSYQLALAAQQQAAAAANKTPSGSSVAAAQQALVELQRQYLLDMIPSQQQQQQQQRHSGRHGWHSNSKR